MKIKKSDLCHSSVLTLINIQSMPLYIQPDFTIWNTMRAVVGSACDDSICFDLNKGSSLNFLSGKKIAD